MPKKKLFDKKNSVTFQLVHRSQRDPLIADESVGEHVLQPVERKQKKNVEEHFKYGIYYDDDYNYLQHLRDVNEVSEFELEDRFVVRAPCRTNLSSTLFETKGVELNVGLLNQAAPSGVQADLDPEVVAALEGDFDFENANNALEDNFVLLANEGELPSAEPPVRIDTRPLSGRVPTADDSDAESDSEHSESQTDGEFDEQDEEEDNVNGVSAANLSCKRSGLESDLICEAFDRIYDDYDDGDFERASDEEGVEDMEPDSVRMMDLVKEHERAKADAVVDRDEVMRHFAERACNDGPEHFEKVCSDSGRREKDDCMSVLLKASTTYNRPCSIKEPVSTKGSSAIRSFHPTDVPDRERDVEMEEEGEERSMVRRRGESLEEKKARKRAVKMHRSERRIEKKARKIAFKNARKALVAEIAIADVKAVPIL